MNVKNVGKEQWNTLKICGKIFIVGEESKNILF
jgi:hypothetical protein